MPTKAAEIKAQSQREPSRGSDLQSTEQGECVFCALLASGTPFQQEWEDAVALVPLNPVTAGHLLIIPRQHVADAAEDPEVSAAVMRRAAEYAQQVGPGVNIITSVGSAATQTVLHLHLHIVPRRFDDGLTLPWTVEHPSGQSEVEQVRDGLR